MPASDRRRRREGAMDANAATARKMFWAGCAALPWLWVANVLYFLPAWRARSLSAETVAWLWRSVTGAVLASAAFVAWVLYVQLTWKDWSPGMIRSLMVNVPEKDEDAGW